MKVAFENEIQVIMKRINSEIDRINDEIKSIDANVERDINSLIVEYQTQIEKVNLDIKQLIQQYSDYLKRKKQEALGNAKKKLEALRDELMIAVKSIKNKSTKESCLVTK